MKVTVIGCWAAYPAPGEATSGYLLESGGHKLLLDCGSAVVSKLGKCMDLNDLDSVLISHFHMDHMADLKCLQHAVRIQTQLGHRRKKLRAFGPDDPEFFDALDYEKVVLGSFFDENTQITEGPFHISFSKNVHERLGYTVKIEADHRTVVYTGDTGWYEKLPDFSYKADLLICESSLYNKFEGMVPGHLSARQAGQLALMARPGKMLLSHLPPYEDQTLLLTQARKAAAGYKGSIELAREGWKMEWV